MENRKLDKRFTALVAALCALAIAILAVQAGCCTDPGGGWDKVDYVEQRLAAAEPIVTQPPTLTTVVGAELPFPMPTIIDAPCIETVSGIWAEANFPGKSAAELSYVHVMAKGNAELPYPPLGGYWYERVDRVLLAPGWVAAECSPLHEKITFILSEDLDIGD